MALRKRLFFNTADTTPETVYTNVSGQVTKLETLTMANPVGGIATNILLSIGADGATTRVIVYPLDAGPITRVVNPNLVITGTEIVQLSSTASDDVAVITGNGTVELVA